MLACYCGLVYFGVELWLVVFVRLCCSRCCAVWLLWCYLLLGLVGAVLFGFVYCGGWWDLLFVVLCLGSVCLLFRLQLLGC